MDLPSDLQQRESKTSNGNEETSNGNEETSNVNGERKNAGFSSTIGTYITLIGYSAGMSDFWRFPFLVYRNGGGAFLIPFILTTCICGIPLFFLEYTLANFSGKGPYRIWDVSPFFRGMGISMLVGCTIYVMCGTVFRGWLIYFFINSFGNPLPWSHCNNTWNTDTCKTNPFLQNQATEVTQNMTSLINASTPVVTTTINITGMTAAEEYWQYETLRLSTGLSDWGSFNWRVFLCIIAFRLLVGLAMVKSIKSIEKVMFLTTFTQFGFIIVVFIRSLTLPGAVDGLARFFRTDFSSLSNPKIWIEAFLMSFYTMGFGWGTSLMMGSYAKFKDNSLRTCAMIPIIDSFVAIMTGTVCFSVLGNMAAAYGVQVDEVFSSGMSIGVISYVTALAALPLPQLWSAGFMFSVIMSGIDTQVVPVEMCLQVIGEMVPGLFPKHRLLVFLLFSGSLVLFALPTATGAGAYIFLWMDWYAGAWVGTICALLEIVVVAWVYGIDRFNSDIILMIGRSIPAFIRVILVFFAPCLVLIILLISIIEYVSPYYGTYRYPDWARVLGWLMVMGIMLPMPFVAVKTVVSQSGSFVKRLKKALRPSLQWVPKDESLVEEYQKKRAKFHHRTFKEVLYFSLFGHYKGNADLVPQTELSPL